MARRSRRRRDRSPSPQPAHSSFVAPILTGNHSDQNSCPLFSLIPPELRHEIFVLALTSYDDETRPFPPTAYYTRKGYRYHQRIHTALLATCLRIYSETRDLPISLNEHVFWFYRGPEGLNGDPRAYFLGLTPRQRDAVQRVHFFTQLYWLRHDFARVCALPKMRPKHLKITIRHSDWWWWEHNERLSMENPVWGKNLKMIQSLESFEIEMETMERDKDQDIAQEMLKWRFDLFGGRVLTTNGTEIKRGCWIGQSSFGGQYRYIADRNEWEIIQASPVAEYGPEPGLAYHVVTLRWQPEAQTT